MPTTFEEGFVDAERSAEAVARTATGVLAAARKMRAAARLGDIGELRRWATRLCDLAESVRQESLNAREAWPFSADDEIQYLREGYAAELVEVAKGAGLKLVVSDDKLLAFPLVLRISAADRSLRLGRGRTTGLRPTSVLALVRAAQSKPPRFANDKFLEALYRAYGLLAREGDGSASVVSLARIYEALTILPGASTEYGVPEFVRDLFLLDRAAVTRTRSGARLAFHASTGTKGGRDVFSLIAPDGETKTYFAVSFTPEHQ